MLSKVTIAAFVDEVTKIAGFTSGEKMLLTTGLVGGGLGGAYVKDAIQDAQEGRTLRKGREFQQKQQLKAFNQEMNNA